jgi:C-terminal processing protease CtpA/Prc
MDCSMTTPCRIPAWKTVVLLLLGLTVICSGQSIGADGTLLDGLLSFEGQHGLNQPGTWRGGPAAAIAFDDQVVHQGRWSVRLQLSGEASPSGVADIGLAIPIDFRGKRVELSGFVRTRDVTNYSGLWMREDNAGRVLLVDNASTRGLKGTNEWTEYKVSLPIIPEASQLYIGAILVGPGALWVDDLRVLVDGKPVADLPHDPTLVSGVDKTQVGGSGVSVRALSEVQTQNLYTLGKVWGFLKYHHPTVTAGRRNWDSELFQVLPVILAATGRTEANLVMSKWIGALGPPGPCGPCAVLPSLDLALKPDLAWIRDELTLGPELSGQLKAIYDNRRPNQQFYVSEGDSVRNPVFANERAYDRLDAGFQILALYRFWNIIEYWSPYRSVIGESWDNVLLQFIPKLALFKTRTEYENMLQQLLARVNDGHIHLAGSLRPESLCLPPARVRFVQGKAVVDRVSQAAPQDGLRPGDIVLEVDGKPVESLVVERSPFYSASNDAGRLRDLASLITGGACGPMALRVLRGGAASSISTVRQPIDPRVHGLAHERPGPAFQMLSPEVAYLKLSLAKAADVPTYLESAAHASGLIIDMRSYPSENLLYALGGHLVDSPTAFARITSMDLSNPGAFYWREPYPIPVRDPVYPGKVVLLVDEGTQSAAEFETMGFRASPRAMVIGSMTAGADGDVSELPLPGGKTTHFSGLGIFYPDGKPTQRSGISLDLEVKPTIEGVAAGRDEVLEAAIRAVAGSVLSRTRIEQIASDRQAQSDQ